MGRPAGLLQPAQPVKLPASTAAAATRLYQPTWPSNFCCASCSPGATGTTVAFMRVNQHPVPQLRCPLKLLNSQ